MIFKGLHPGPVYFAFCALKYAIGFTLLYNPGFVAAFAYTFSAFFRFCFRERANQFFELLAVYRHRGSCYTAFRLALFACALAACRFLFLHDRLFV